MIGIDIPIQQLTTIFTNKLWTSYNCDFNGRIYDNEKKDKGIDPELFLSGKQYKEKLLDSKQDATVFFRITGTDLETQIADVQIYFSVNLATLYPTIVYRADEHAIQDAKKCIDYSAFNISDVVRGRDAFSDYFGADQNKHDMQPFCLFRFDTTCFFQTSTCLSSTSINYNLTLSSSFGGTTVPAPGIYSYLKNTIVPIYASSNENYDFDKFIIDGVEVATNPIYIKIVADSSISASFVGEELTTIAELLNSVPVKVGNEWRGGNNNGNVDNYVVYKNTTIYTSNGGNGGITYPNGVLYSTSPRFQARIRLNNLSISNHYIAANRGSGNNWLLRVSNNRLIATIFTGTTNVTIEINIPDTMWYDIDFNVNNTSKTFYISAIKVIDGTVITANGVFTGSIPNVNSFIGVGFDPATMTLSMYADMAYYNINNGERIVYLQNRNGIDVYNSANNKIQDATFTNISIQDAYRNTDETGTIEPYSYTKGVSIYSLNSDPTNEDEYINVVYSEDGTPAISTPPVGYSLVGNYSVGSGLLLGVKNVILFNQSSELTDFFNNYPMGAIGQPKSFRTIKEWQPSDAIIIDGTDNNITKLTFKN